MIHLGAFKFRLILSFAVLSIGINAVRGQDLCEAIVDNALRQIALACTDDVSGVGCYGYDRINATFYIEENNEEILLPNFNRAGDNVALEILQTLQSRGIDLEDAEWGLSYLHLYTASTNAEEATRILIMGDVFVENNPTNPDELGDDIERIVQTMTRERAFLEFYFVTGSHSDCIDAPNVVIIQAPVNQAIELRSNGVTMHVEATVVMGMEITDEGEWMWVTALDGDVVLNPDTPQQQIIPRNHTTSAQITPVGDAVMVRSARTTNQLTDERGQMIRRRIPSQNFSTPIPLRPSAESFRGWAYYGTLVKIPPTLLNMPIMVESVTMNCQPQPRNALSQLTAFTSPSGRGLILSSIPASQIQNRIPLNSVRSTNGDLWFEFPYEIAGRTTIWLNANDFMATGGCESIGTGIEPTLSPDLRRPTATPTRTTDVPSTQEMSSSPIMPVQPPSATPVPAPSATPTILPG